MSGNGLFFEKSNDELIWPPGGREILEGGRASWLVPFGVINHHTKQNPRHEKEGGETGRREEGNPPPKPPPEGKKRQREGGKRKPKGKRGREGEREKKKDVHEGKKQ